MISPEKIEQTVNEIFSLYKKYGSADYIGEPVSQIEHMVQSAQLAEKEGYDEEVILAAFFHDIGHICEMDDKQENMGGYGVMRHEKFGADFLRKKGFSERIAKLVENHVQAKRYLTLKKPEYYANLSEASKKTLEYQGGKMNEKEAVDFENDNLFKASIKMREWDELAKEIDVPVPNLQYLKEMCRRHLEKIIE